jgi:hypothetical protein
VLADLTELHGPTGGVVRLPLRLFWSPEGQLFDLDDRDMLLWLYQVVLREASRPADLVTYLDRNVLISIWPDLYLPTGVRRAWEGKHQVLRAA